MIFPARAPCAGLPADEAREGKIIRAFILYMLKLFQTLCYNTMR